MNVIEKGNRAKALLEDEVLQDALKRMREGLISGMEQCPQNDRERLHQLHDSLAFLRGFRRNLEMFVADATAEEFRIEQEKRNYLGDLSAWTRKT